MSQRVLDKRVPKDIPPELDFTSESFDPAKVLAAESVCLPFPKAKTYNNLAEYYSHTFLKKEDLESNRGAKEETRERNYAWYYSTMGYDPSYGNEYYTEMYRSQNKVKRRKGKKPASTTTSVCENMRTNKVVKLKSKYKLYCQRKFNKWKRDISSPQRDVAATETSDLWTSTSNYAKEFINPSASSSSMSSTLSQRDFLANLLEASDLENFSTMLPPVEKLNTNSGNRNMVLKFDNYSDPLSFLKCMLFGKIETTNQKISLSNPNLMKPSIGETENQNLQLMTDQNIRLNSGSDDLLCFELNAVNRSDNSAYETESSGYMSDCSEAERSTRPSKNRVVSKNLNLMETLMKSKQSKNTNKLNRQAGVVENGNVLKCKGNNLILETQSKESIDESFKNSEDQSIIVKIDRKFLKVGSRESENSKKSKSLNGCVCDIRSSKELTCQCVCGFYKKAINEIRKFKIPRKKKP